MNRIEKFYQIKEFEGLEGLPEKLVDKEIETEESLGNDFRFSKKEYNGKQVILGKINDWYFLGGTGVEFEVFEDKKMILLYLKQEFEKANQGKSNEDELDSSWKGFWAREVETLGKY